MTEPPPRDKLDEYLDKESTKLYLGMSNAELAIYVLNAGYQVGSRAHEFAKQLILARVGDQVSAAVKSLEEANDRSARELNATTRRLVFATWGLVIATIGLLVATIVLVVHEASVKPP